MSDTPETQKRCATCKHYNPKEPLEPCFSCGTDDDAFSNWTPMFDHTKPVQTRDGRKARIICTDLAGEFPLVSAIVSPGEGECLCSHRLDGTCGTRPDEESPLDLVNVPNERTEQ